MSITSPNLAIDPNRLCAAADVLLQAMRSPLGLNTRIPMSIGPFRVGASLPPGLFTTEEFIEAMTMLIRMDCVPPQARTSRRR